ncbi:MAG: sensor histidine kinase, partial [Thermoanaerobaculum sp.]
PVVSEASQLAGPCLSGGGIRLTAQLPPDLPLVRADRARLREVLLNLFLNACDAMGGQGEVRVWAKASGKAVHVWVQDTGPGVPAEIRDKIFMPFFTTKKEKGTGLGLALARAAMREMGGDLQLVPTSSGACFELTLEPA